MADLLIAGNSVPASGADLKPASGSPQFATSGNPQNSIPATIWPAYAANMILTELYNIVLASGITPSGADWAQVWQALLCTGVFQDVGVVNAMRTLLPNIVNQPNNSSVFNNLRVGTRVRVIVANTNTSATVTLNTLNVGAVNVIRPDGTALKQGDLPAGQIIEFIYDGTNWRGLGQLNFLPTPPLAGLTVYVRTDGNDNNTGLANTSAGAFATIQGAVNGVTSQFALPPSRSITIVLGLAGTYTGNISFPTGSNFVVQGLTSAQGSYIISGGTVPNVHIVGAIASQVNLINLTVQNTANTVNWCNAAAGGLMNLTNVQFTQTSNTNNVNCVDAQASGSIVCNGVIFNGVTPLCCFQSQGSGGSITLLPGSSMTFQGGVTVTGSVAQVTDLGYMILGPSIVESGSATGKQYNVINNGVLNSQGNGTGIFPGTVTGTTSAGGIFE